MLLKRIAIIDREIGEKRFPNKNLLAGYLEVSSKTIQRDIEYMKLEYNAPIKFDKHRKGFFYSDKYFRLNPIKIDYTDLLSLAVIQKIFEQYKATPYIKYFKNFFQKISLLSTEKISISPQDLINILSFDISPVRKIDEKIMDTISESFRSFRILSIKYYSGYKDEISDRKVNPYHIKNYNGDWYLIGYCHKSGGIRIFAVSRIKNIKLTNQHYSIPYDFSIEQYFKNSFGIFESKELYHIKLHFKKHSAKYIKEKIWHPSQSISQGSDGSVLLEMKINNLTEIKMWILSFGSQCTVIAPDELKIIILNETKSLLKNYSI